MNSTDVIALLRYLYLGSSRELCHDLVPPFADLILLLSPLLGTTLCLYTVDGYPYSGVMLMLLLVLIRMECMVHHENVKHRALAGGKRPEYSAGRRGVSIIPRGHRAIYIYTYPAGCSDSGLRNPQSTAWTASFDQRSCTS
jgi:hypothetical protein